MESQAEARKRDLFRNDPNLQRLLKRSLGLGYVRWGTHPVYARVEERIVPGHYYYKLLEGPAATP